MKESSAAASSVLAPGRRVLTIGLVMTVTLVGFESLAVSTALPAIARDLHGLGLYGWVFSAYMLGTLLGTVVAGQSADRYGPARPFAVGITIFVIGLVAAGSAPTMQLLVVARFVQGTGGGAVPAVAYVVAGRGYPPELRPRVFAIMSSAWVVPGLIGPSVSAFITEHASWRWTFFALLPIAIPVGIATVPALATLEPVSQPGDDATHLAVEGYERRRAALVCTMGVAAVFVGTSGLPLPLAAPAIAAGTWFAARAYLRLVPAGTVRLARGLPATIAMRGFQTFALFGLDAFVPHLVHDVRGRSLTMGSLAVTVAAVTWTAGSWAQARYHDRRTPRFFVACGLALIGAGGIGLIATAFEQVPIAVGVVTYGIAGFGMGLGYSAVSVAMLDQADAGREGAASSALAVTDVLWIAISTGIGGALIRLAEVQQWSLRTGIVSAFTLPTIVAVVGVFAARRLSGSQTHEHAGA